MKLGSNGGVSSGRPKPPAGGAVKRGLGDLFKGISKALGIKPCGGCNERAQKLNKLSGKIRF